MKKQLTYTLWITTFIAVSAVIGKVTQGAVDGWYADLNHPPFTPPDIVFPIVWTILYGFIAAAGCTLWFSSYDPRAKKAFRIFIAYMLLNWSWSIVFFGMKMLLSAFLWIIVMNIFAVAIIALAWKPARSAALLMLPPTAWTLFAAVLSGAFWYLNPYAYP